MENGLVWFELVQFILVWFFMLQLVRLILVSIHTKCELSRCLVCPTIEINMLDTYPQNELFPFSAASLVKLLLELKCNNNNKNTREFFDPRPPRR